MRSSDIASVNRRPDQVAKVGDLDSAMDAVSAHLECPNHTDGSGAQVPCPALEAVWDIRTGALGAEPKIKPEMPCEEEALKAPLRTYPAREVEGFVEIDI